MLRAQLFDTEDRPGAGASGDATVAREPVALSVETDLDAIADLWRAFERTADGTVFQSWAWQSAWQRHIGARRGVAPAIVIGRRADGTVLFLFPLAVVPAGPVRRLTWLAGDLCDYNGPLLAPDFGARIGASRFAALWREIGVLLQADRRFRHDAIVLDKMPERVGAQANPFLGLGSTLNPSGAYIAHLTGDFESFYAARRSAARRKSDRWKRRRLAHHGEVAFVTVAREPELGETLDVLFAQKARSLTEMGVVNMFANPGQADFYRAVASAPHAIAHVSRLDVGSQPAAVNFGLVFRGRYYHVLASYADGEIARFGPGAVHLQHLIEYAIERGCALFDFTIGDEPYKREWCDEELALHDVRRAVTPLGFAVSVPSRVQARIKRTIKQTPFLWNLAQAVRARLGALRGAASGRDASRDEAGDEPPAGGEKP